MTFLTDEAGIESSRPREGLELILPMETIRYATGTRDVTIDGETYRASPSQRTTIVVAKGGADQNEMQLVLPATDPFVRRFVTATPALVLVNLWRKQLQSGEEQCWHRGYIASVGIEDGIATFSIPNRPDSMLNRRLSTVVIGRSCPHVLYNANCGVSAAGFKVTTTITIVAGRVVTVASMGAHPDDWARFGKIVHVPTGEPMSVVSQTGIEIVMRAPVLAMQTGHAVEVYAGCDLSVGTCRDKFAAVARFGGQPDLPKKNPFFSNSRYGFYQSE